MAFQLSFAMRTCGHCGLRRAQFYVVKPDALTTTAKGEQRNFALLSCPDCGGITVVEHREFGDETYIVGTWPESTERAADVDHLPPYVAGYYTGARKVLDAGVPEAAAVQLRRTLEAAAAHHGQTQRVLVQRIQALIEEGLVTKQFGEALTLIRKVGNQGAHATDEKLSQETVELALKFTTQFLRNLFEVPEELRIATQAAPADEPEQQPEAEPDEGTVTL